MKHGRRVLLSVIALGSFIVASEVFGQQGAEGGEWRHHGGDLGSTLYSSLDQINVSNVKELQVAWRWKSPDGDVVAADPSLKSISRIYHYEATPQFINGTLYTSTSMGQVAAINPETGETLWVYDPKAYESGRPTNLGFLTRGMGYWTDGESERLLHAPNDAYLIALDPKTGKPDPEFGIDGRVDLTQGLGVPVENRRNFLRAYTITSPPIVCRDVVVVGSSIRDTPNFRALPPGHVRGYDVRTGTHLWTFHTIPRPGEFGNDTWENDSWKGAGSTNVWTLMSADEDLGYVYFPVGTPSHNWYGGDRPGDNLFACSLVCIEAESGKRVWHFQTVHHPIWDYDPPAAPNLIDIEVDGKAIKAVALLTKQGFLFTFDRKTGEPVWPIEERAVPQDGVPGEILSPTQPFPTKPAPFEPNGFTEADIINYTPKLREKALAMAAEWRLGPVYTPPSLQGTVVNPGWSGGGNWNGAAFDPETQILYVPSYTNYSLVMLVEPDPNRSDFRYVWSGSKTPHVEGLPLVNGPYSRITAIDMNTGEHLWKVGIGRGSADHPSLKDLNLEDLGRGLSEGELFPMLTKSLLFVTQDRNENYPPTFAPNLRALDKTDGKVVWEHELPASVHATPMTYSHAGKQYVVVALGAGLYQSMQEPDELIAFALPK